MKIYTNDLVKGHSDFKVKCLTFGLYTQVSDSGPLGPLVLFPFARTQDYAFIFSELERKISVRSTRDELIKKGVIKERVDDTIVEANENQNNATTTIQADTVTSSPDTAVVKAEENHAPATVEQGMCLK